LEKKRKIQQKKREVKNSLFTQESLSCPAKESRDSNENGGINRLKARVKKKHVEKGLKLSRGGMLLRTR